MHLTNMYSINTLVKNEGPLIYTPVWQLCYSWIKVDFHACVCLPGCSLDSCSSCFSMLYAIHAMNQCFVNFYGSVVSFFIPLFFSSTPYWFQSKVKPEGNQAPLILPHISVSWSNMYQSSMMNCTLYKSHCDTIYWFLHDRAHFGVPCVAGGSHGPLGANGCDCSVWSLLWSVFIIKSVGASCCHHSTSVLRPR